MSKNRKRIIKLGSLSIIIIFVFLGFKVHKNREEKSWESFRIEQEKILEENENKEKEKILRNRELNAKNNYEEID